MDHLGLTAAELSEYHQALRFTHERRLRVDVLTLEGRPVRSLSPVLFDGQVMVDVDSDVSRVLDLAFLDPSRSLGFEPDEPRAVPLHRSRMVQVHYAVRVPALSRWVSAEVFTGPIWDFDRQGAEVRLVGHGKERLSLGQLGKGITYQAKSLKTAAIRGILTETGEGAISVPRLKPTLPHPLSLGPMDQGWVEAKKLASSMDRQLFYPGNGRAYLRPHSLRPVFRFRNEILGEPKIRRNLEGLFNTIIVVGADPKGPKKRIHVRVSLPAAHPLSPESLGRNGKPQYLIYRDENDHIKTEAEARSRARRLLIEKSTALFEMTFDSLPVPHLQELDCVMVDTDDFGLVPVRLRQFGIPLSADPQPMTVGTIRRTTKARLRTGGKDWQDAA